MTTLRIHFPWGRYYAHPWGINPVRLKEGEWPPSPWRLLRALSSAWFQLNPGSPADQPFFDLLDALGKELPEIGFNKISFGHTAHWQPNYGAADAAGKAAFIYKKTRHENHFVAVSGPVFFHWPDLDLKPELAQLLESILQHISYFGRAESICEMTLESELPQNVGWVRPCLQDGKPTRRMAEDCRDVFCPDPSDFQAADLWSLRDGRTSTSENLPAHLVDQILAKQPMPDGARWVSYQMPDGWPEKYVVRVAKKVRSCGGISSKPVAHTLRFSLQCRINIPLKATVDIAERYRQSAIKRFKQACGSDAHSFALSGHEPTPEGVSGDHMHAHFLPLPSRIDHSQNIHEIDIWAPCGFTQSEIEALMRVKTLHWGASKFPIRPVLTSIDQKAPDFLTQKPAKTWQSLTPYVPPRHFYRGTLHGAKLKQKDSPENQLASEIQRHNIHTSFEICRIPIDTKVNSDAQSPSKWEIVRTPGDNPAFDEAILTETHSRVGNERRIGFMFELTFADAVTLPRPLGHSCHFGLGLFMPIS